MADSKNTSFGLLAEFNNPAELLEAAGKIKDAGYKKFDCYSPFPIHGMDSAMGLDRSNLGKIVAVVAFFAMIGALSLQWWTNAVDYPFVISGKPFMSYQSYAPIGFALSILTSGVCTLIVMLALNGLPRFHHPLFYSDNFKKATDDGFFVDIESGDPKYNEQETENFLKSLGAKNIEVLKADD